ncbi:MAG: hypothetical protein ACK4TG_03565 [Thermaurantiacus sp.]
MEIFFPLLVLLAVALLGCSLAIWILSNRRAGGHAAMAGTPRQRRRKRSDGNEDVLIVTSPPPSTRTGGSGRQTDPDGDSDGD